MIEQVSSVIPADLTRGRHWLLVLVTATIIIAIWVVDCRGTYESPLALTALTFLFSTSVLLMIVFLLGRSFLRRGEAGLLLFGCGALIWGYGSLVASIFAGRDVNLAPAIANVSGAISALCHMSGVLVSLQPRPRVARRWRWLVIAYSLAAGGAVLMTVATLAGWMPAFFIQGRGGTPLRYVVLGFTITLLVLTALLMLLVRREPVSAFAYYYAIALILFATGFFAAMLQAAVFSALFWTALTMQFIGGAYMLRAAIECVRARSRGDVSLTPLVETWRNNAFCAAIRQQKPLHFALRYVVAVVLVAAAAGLRSALTTWLGPGLPPYVTFVPAVTVAALVAGFWPGVLATALTMWTVHEFRVASGDESAIALLSPIDRVELLWFCGMGILISTVAALYRRSRDKAAAYDRERAVHESQARLAAFAEATFEGIVETEGGKILDCNEQFSRMTGYSAAELSGRCIAELAAPEDRARLLAEGDGRGSTLIECAAIRKDGARLFLEAHSRPMPFGGQRHHIAVRDITERKRTEEELRTVKERFEAYMANSPLAVVELDAGGRVLRWSGAAEQVFGWPANEVLGKRASELAWFTSDDVPPFVKGSGNLRGTPCPCEVSRHRRKDESIVDCEWYNSALFDENGQVMSVMSLALDITQREKAERALREAEEQLRNYATNLEALVQERTARLEATVQELEEYSYSISHDLRAPLRAMNEYANLIIEMHGSVLQPQGQRYLGRISAAATRLDRLINDVLSYHRTAHAEMKLEPIDLYPLVRDITEQYPAIERSHARIEVIGSLPPVLANVAALTQCISNLLDNAVKFVAPGAKPMVKISSEVRGSFVRVWIADNGIGVEPAQVDRIWGLFRQANVAKASEGTGIGLTIVKKAVERMGGKVGMEPAAGGGSRFWFELRAAPTINQPAEAPLGLTGKTKAGAGRVLPGTSLETGARALRVAVVDDSEDDIFFLVRAMKSRKGFSTVATLSGGEEAIRYFRRESPFVDTTRFPEPDLVLLDLKMPGTDGFSVLQQLREHLPARRFRVVVLTSSSSPSDRQQSFDLGADGFETKPTDHTGYLQLLDNIERSLTGDLANHERELTAPGL